MTFTAFSQIEKPVEWFFSVEHVSDNTYDLVIQADIKKGWNVYSQHVNPDGPIPTSFLFFNETKKSFELIDQVQESEPITKYDPVFQMELSSFQNKAIFKQRIQLLNDTLSIVRGELEFMACNSEMCLPPDVPTTLYPRSRGTRFCAGYNMRSQCADSMQSGLPPDVPIPSYLRTQEIIFTPLSKL